MRLWFNFNFFFNLNFRIGVSWLLLNYFGTIFSMPNLFMIFSFVFLDGLANLSLYCMYICMHIWKIVHIQTYIVIVIHTYLYIWIHYVCQHKCISKSFCICSILRAVQRREKNTWTWTTVRGMKTFSAVYFISYPTYKTCQKQDISWRPPSNIPYISSEKNSIYIYMYVHMYAFLQTQTVKSAPVCEVWVGLGKIKRILRGQ